MQESVTLRNNRLSAINATLGNSGVLKLWAGAYPPNCAAVDPATLLLSVALPSLPFSVAFGVATLTAALSVNGSGTGYACCYRLYDGSGNCHMQGYASQAWVPLTTYVAWQQVSNINGTFLCAIGGVSASTGTGPSGSGSGITDGSCTWTALSLTADLIMATTYVAAGVGVSISNLTITAANA